MGEAAFDRAQTHADVFPRPGDAGRFSRILISESVDDDVRVVFFDVGGNRVDETQKSACGTAFLLVGSGACRAAAVVFIVVQGYRYYGAPGIVFQDLPDSCFRFFQHCGVGQTGLFVPRHPAKAAECVNESAVADVAAHLFGERPAVDPVLQTPYQIVAALPVGLAVFEYRSKREAFVYNDITVSRRLETGREKTRPGASFKQREHSVAYASAVAAADTQRIFA